MNLDILNIPKNKITQFQKKGIFSLEDLLNFIPKKYLDYRKPLLCKELEEGIDAAIIGTVIYVKNVKEKKFFIAKCKDVEGKVFDVCWFGNVYGLEKIMINGNYFFSGKIQKNTYNNNLQDDKQQ